MGMREEQRRHVVGQRRIDRVPLDQDLSDTPTGERRQAFHHIGIGREIAGLGQDHGPLRCQLQTGAQGLENID